MDMTAISTTEAVFSLIGMIMHGQILDAMFSTLRPLTMLFFTIALFSGVSRMALSGKAATMFAYMVGLVSAVALLRLQVDIGDFRVHTEGLTVPAKVKASVEALRPTAGGSRANTLFFFTVRAMVVVRDAMISVISRAFGEDVDFRKGPFGQALVLAEAINFKVKQGSILSDTNQFFDACYTHTAVRAQAKGQQLNPFIFFGGAGATAQDIQDIRSGAAWQFMQTVQLSEGERPQEVVSLSGLSAGSLFDTVTSLGRVIGRSEVFPPRKVTSEEVATCAGAGAALGEWVSEYVEEILPELVGSSEWEQLGETRQQAALMAAKQSALEDLYRTYSDRAVAKGLGGNPETSALGVAGGVVSGIVGGAGGLLASILSFIGPGVTPAIMSFIYRVAPAVQGWALMILYAMFPLVAVFSLLPGFHARILDWIGAVWWVHSWPFFWALFGAFYRVTTTIASQSSMTQGSDIGSVATMGSWMALFFTILTPLISFAVFFGRPGHLAGMRFRLVGLGAMSRLGGRLFRA